MERVTWDFSGRACTVSGGYFSVFMRKTLVTLANPTETCYHIALNPLWIRLKQPPSVPRLLLCFVPATSSKFLVLYPNLSPRECSGLLDYLCTSCYGKLNIFCLVFNTNVLQHDTVCYIPIFVICDNFDMQLQTYLNVLYCLSRTAN